MRKIVEYKTAHYVRHKLSGLYFRPGGQLVKERGKLYYTNNDVLAQAGHYIISTSYYGNDKEVLDIIRTNLEATGIEPEPYGTGGYWIMPSGEKVYHNGGEYMFTSHKDDFERIPVKLTITTEIS